MTHEDFLILNHNEEVIQITLYALMISLWLIGICIIKKF